MNDPMVPSDHTALLQQQMEQLALILQTMAEGVSIFDRDNALVLCNQGFLEMYRFPNWLNQPGTPIAEFSRYRLGTIKGLKGKALESAVEERNRTITEEVGELEHAKRETLDDGRIVDVRRRRTDDGFLISTYVDITDRVASDQALRDSEARYKAILEDQTELISRLDTDFNLTFANTAYQKTYVKDPDTESVIGRNILSFIADEDVREAYAERMRSLTPEEPIVRTVLKEYVVDGTLQWQSWVDRALFDEHGTIVGYQSAGRDITAEKQAELALAESSRERLAIVEGSLDAIITFDGEGHIRDFNPAAQEMFGYSNDEVDGRRVSDLILPAAEDADTAAGLEAYLRKTQPDWEEGRRIEIETRHKDGRRIPTELAIVDASGDERSLFVAYLRDLTETKRMQESITQTEKMGALGSLLANVAHELNNPLAVVIGQADILNETVRDEAVISRAKRIKTAADKCARIVRTFLAAARQKPPESLPFSADGPARESLELVDYGFKTSGIEFNVQIDEALPGLFGDAGQIGQVLANLLVNAQQALTECPMPRRAAFQATLSEDGEQVVYRISDNGPGVPEHIRDRIFEPFFTTKEEGSGTGIGLAIAHNIASAHNGELTLSDEPPMGGATFELRLPVHTKAEDGAEPRADTPNKTVTKRIHILVVDDEEDVAETIADHLVIAGYHCEIATGGTSALDHLAQGQFDAVLSDLRMPDMDGPALYREAEARWPGVQSRFGFFTGDSLSPAASRFLKETSVPVIEKPFTRAALQELIETVLTRAADKTT